MNFQGLSELQINLLIRAINTELNIIAKHYADQLSLIKEGKIHESAKVVWSEQYLDLNEVFVQIQAESARRLALKEARIDSPSLDERAERYG